MSLINFNCYYFCYLPNKVKLWVSQITTDTVKNVCVNEFNVIFFLLELVYDVI